MRAGATFSIFPKTDKQVHRYGYKHMHAWQCTVLRANLLMCAYVYITLRRPFHRLIDERFALICVFNDSIH